MTSTAASEARLTMALLAAGAPNVEILGAKSLTELLGVAQRHGIQVPDDFSDVRLASTPETDVGKERDDDSRRAPTGGPPSDMHEGEHDIPSGMHEAAKNISSGAYEGERNEAGEWEGHGTYRFYDGTVYEGSWKANQQHGRGIMYYLSGASYSGEWRAGKKHGKGTYYWADGRVEVGLYEADESVGEGCMWSADQRSAWKIIDDGREVHEISLAEARRVAERVGEPVPERACRTDGLT